MWFEEKQSFSKPKNIENIFGGYQKFILNFWKLKK